MNPKRFQDFDIFNRIQQAQKAKKNNQKQLNNSLKCTTNSELEYEDSTTMSLNLARIVFKAILGNYEDFKLVSRRKAHFINIPNWFVDKLREKDLFNSQHIYQKVLNSGEVVYSFNILNGNVWSCLIDELTEYKNYKTTFSFRYHLNNFEKFIYDYQKDKWISKSPKKMNETSVTIPLNNGGYLTLFGQTNQSTQIEIVNNLLVCENWYDFEYVAP